MERIRDVRPVHGEQPLLNHSLPSDLPPRPGGDPTGLPAHTVDAIAERLFSRSRTLRRDEVARLSGVPLRVARRFWRALGLQNARAEDTVFSNADIDALVVAGRLLERYEIDEDVLVSLVRGIGTTTERLATWQAEVIAERLQDFERLRHRRDDGDHWEEPASKVAATGQDGLADRVTPEVANATGYVLAELADDIERLVGYSWRRHLISTLSTLMADATAPDVTTGVTRSVGFADMVSFSERVARSSDLEIARMVTRFEELVGDVVARYGGRLVKTIGDEVLFQAVEPRAAALIAHDLVHLANDDPGLPPLRVGVATGRVLLRLGDVYGDTVNRAARLTTSAVAGSVLTDASTAEALGHDPAWRFAALPSRPLHGIGTVTPHQLLSVPPGASNRPTSTPGGTHE